MLITVLMKISLPTPPQYKRVAGSWEDSNDPLGFSKAREFLY